MMIKLKRVYHTGRRSLANFWLNGVHRKTLQIGITGSYGKTSTTHILADILNRHTPTLTTDLNLDTIYNLPITALKLRGQRCAVFEMGIDKPNEMSFHLNLVRPKIGIITGITAVHADAEHLGSVENIIREKRKLIEALPPDGTAILHYDDPSVRGMASHTRARVVWYGQMPECAYRAENIQVRLDGISFEAVTPTRRFSVQSPLLGRHFASNIMAAVAAADQVGVPIETMQTALAALQPLHGRLNIETGPLGTVLINDALRANPVTTQAGLAFLHHLQTTGKKIAILGEMGELGKLEIEKHREVGQAAANTPPDLLVCVGNLTTHTAQAAAAAGLDAERVFSVPTVHQAAEIIRSQAQPGDLLYLKGSLMRHMERILLILKGETVGCRVVSCPFYHQCPACQYLATGYPEQKALE